MKTVNGKLTSLYENLLGLVISGQYKDSFLFTFVFSMLANAFAYFNLYPQHDSVNHMFEFAGTWEISLGRFLLPLFGFLQGQITMPWLIGIVSIFLISLMVYIVCDLMELHARWQIAAVSGVLSANLCITELTSVFTWTLVVYMLAALLGCAGAYILVKKKSFWRYPAAVLLFVLSMGLYQAEIMVCITLLAVLAVKELLVSEKPFGVIVSYIKYAVALICSVLIYYLLYQLCLNIFHVEPADSYNSLSNIASITAGELMISVTDSYKAFFEFFFGENCFVGVVVTRGCNIFLACLALLLLLIHFVENRKRWINNLLILLILLVLPGIICLLDIFMSNPSLSFYLMYSLYLYYVLLLALIVHCGRGRLSGWDKLVSLIVAVCFLLITTQNIIFSNQIYSYQKIMYDRSVSIATRILDDVESDESYVIGETEVIMIGSLRYNDDLEKTLRIDSELPQTLQGSLGLRSLVNSSGLHGGKILSITYNQTFDSFAWLLGSEINTQSDSDIVSRYTAMEAVRNMPAYPQNGYCRMIDGRMVIKLS